MTEVVFVLVSAVYILSLILVDGAFNRLIFREFRKLPYHSPEKKALYGLWEWKVIGVVHLIVLGMVIPGITAWALGGLKYVLIYAAIFAAVNWDIIFGKIVFDDWWGDTPSIALPYWGWVQTPLSRAIVLRLMVLLVTILLLSVLPIW